MGMDYAMPPEFTSVHDRPNDVAGHYAEAPFDANQSMLEQMQDRLSDPGYEITMPGEKSEASRPDVNDVIDYTNDLGSVFHDARESRDQREEINDLNAALSEPVAADYTDPPNEEIGEDLNDS